jgi:predicted GNAT family N-acyltransferase
MLIKIYDKIPEEAKMIREAVFMKEKGFKGEFDETDHLAKHVLLFCGDTPVATCRFFFSHERECYVIGRIAMRKEFRGKRYGKRCYKVQKKQLVISEVKR